MANFDPSKASDVLAEKARKSLTEAIIADAIDVQTGEEFQAMLCGYITGLVGAAFCFADKSQHRDIALFIEQYVPQAAAQARGILGLPPLGDA